jgi:hypothetical protein
MIDEDFVVYLIEANTNPCLETNSSVLSRLIPGMLDASFSIAIDPLLPPPDLNFKRAHESLHENKYVMVFDEAIEGETLKNLHMAQEESSVADGAFILSDVINDHITSTNQKKIYKPTPPPTLLTSPQPVKEQEQSKKSDNRFMDVEDVRSNIYSSLNDLHTS